MKKQPHYPDRIETYALADGSVETRIYLGDRLVEKRIAPPVWVRPRHALRTPARLDWLSA